MSEDRVEKASAGTPVPEENKAAQPARPARAVAKTAAEEEAERAEFLQAMEQGFDVQDSSRGEMVKGHVVSIGKEFIFVDLGGKSEGVISLEEFRGEGDKLPAVGDAVEACVVSTSGGVVLSRKLAKGVRDREALADAARARIPVEGRVLERNKGGFVVEIAGVRAFCPISQIELRFCDNPDVHLGQRYSFLITKHELEGRRLDVVVSRKALLAAEAERQAEELRKTIKEGDVVSGTVVNIRDFGAFVDLGGLEGLLPISELSHSRVGKVSDVLSIGEEVHVQVVSFDRAKDRIGLSLKRLEADPWEEAQRDFPQGARLKAKVVRLQPFGAFVELAPGLDGLIHVSNMNAPDRVQHPKDLLKEGQEVTVEVLSVDLEKHRIALARIPSDGEFGDMPVLGAVIEGVVDSHAPFGVFVRLGPGRKGLVPNVELGTSKGADNRKDFPEGSKIKVKVIEVTENGKRIRLSRKAALDHEERADFEEFMGKESEAKFGTLGDLLKKKMPPA